MKVYCPKCQGEDIEQITFDPNEQRVSMDDLQANTSTTSYSTRRMRHKATCRTCGYSRQYDDLPIGRYLDMNAIKTWRALSGGW